MFLRSAVAGSEGFETMNTTKTMLKLPGPKLFSSPSFDAGNASGLSTTMRASLARHGRLSILDSACGRARTPSCMLYAALALHRPIARLAAGRSFRRTFFKQLFEEPPREVRTPRYEPGWLEIMIWRGHFLDKVRSSNNPELIDAWRKLMQSKLDRRIPLNSTQALQCLRLLEYLWPGQNLIPPEHLLSPPDLNLARRLLLEVEPEERSQEHIDFVRKLHNACFYYAGSQHYLYIWGSLVRALSRYGCAEEAGNMVSTYLGNPEYVAKAAFFDRENGLVQTVARGLAREGKKGMLNRLAERAVTTDFAHNAHMQSIMVCFFAQREDKGETERWFLKTVGQGRPRPEVFRALASWAMRNGRNEFAKRHFLPLSESLPPKSYWDVILQARLLAGQSLDVVDALIRDRMKDVEGTIEPDGDTLNGLLGVAIELRDSKLGEQIINLGDVRGIWPNEETSLIALQLRLDTGDMAAAKATYQQVKYWEAWRNESKPELLDRYRKLLNRYLLLLSGQPLPDFELMRTLLEAAEEDQVLLGPETVAALCLRFLQNDEQLEVMDMLSVHSFFFSESQRDLVQQALITFCRDTATSTARAWDAYQILSQYFQETSLERRTELMQTFFDRKRPDMASHVFGHMRQHRSLDFHPRLETYVKCLEGFARHPDSQSLGMVHNMLKMDTTLQPDTKLNTALMMAYTACGQPRVALEVWKDISQSPEGPSYATLEAVFWALERTPGGSTQARDLWARIEHLDLDVPPRVYVAYVGAIAGSGRVDDVAGLLRSMTSVVGSEPDAMALAVAHNALPGQKPQEEFREWATSEYPKVWSELSKVGRRVHEHMLCQIMFERGMKA
ncbi:hypothetical protein L249_5761 [Ophiocordyceps polyrhachis-furcata BCC 54312]|uniref:Complex I intermediate-associated protein 84, mitochondrial n=1 Tax=Ophiocordyceps polyrhachis-furcata BCC 54312 TaxID=1330021 RepID=A0A367KZZ8_9HYPO|nr:hypothetical protein L249_5761 [Ophiocordyceps polyrhachis-furcata BCC 54312]